MGVVPTVLRVTLCKQEIVWQRFQGVEGVPMVETILWKQERNSLEKVLIKGRVEHGSGDKSLLNYWKRL